MLDQTNANIERHIKTHTERSDDDRAAVSVLETFLRSNGRINTSFAVSIHKAQGLEYRSVKVVIPSSNAEK